MVRLTTITRETADRLQKCLKTKDDDKLSRLLDPANNRSGARRVIKADEDKIVKQRIKYTASRGFAINNYTLRAIMAPIANDGRPGFHINDNMLSLDAVRSWRTGNRDITFRTAENKEQAKLHAENYGHLSTFVRVLKAVQFEFPGIFLEPDRLWNMDETSVSTVRRKGESVWRFKSSSRWL